MFYHTFDLKSWANILQIMRGENLRYLYQIPTATPRKSFKTVMSPRSTLDGNYLLFFEKSKQIEIVEFPGSKDDAILAACECAERIIRSREKVPRQDPKTRVMRRELFEYESLNMQPVSSYPNLPCPAFTPV